MNCSERVQLSKSYDLTFFTRQIYEIIFPLSQDIHPLNLEGLAIRRTIRRAVRRTIRRTDWLLPNFHHLLPRSVWPRPNLFHVHMWHVAHYMPCTLEKIIMAEVSMHIQSCIHYDCGISHLRLYYHIFRNVYISTTTVPTATKPGRVVTHHEELLPLKSHSSLVTWFCEISWHIKNISYGHQTC